MIELIKSLGGIMRAVNWAFGTLSSSVYPHQTLERALVGEPHCASGDYEPAENAIYNSALPENKRDRRAEAAKILRIANKKTGEALWMIIQLAKSGESIELDQASKFIAENLLSYNTEYSRLVCIRWRQEIDGTDYRQMMTSVECLVSKSRKNRNRERQIRSDIFAFLNDNYTSACKSLS